MFRYMTQTVLQHIIKHKSVLAISRIFKKKKKKKTVAIRVYDNGRRQYDESASFFFLLQGLFSPLWDNDPYPWNWEF